MVKTALYLAHMNPVTIAHTQIIEELCSTADTVVIMPVVFSKDSSEINSKSFPFTFEVRRDMIKSVFGDSVRVSKTYEFHTPFSKYIPPLFSPASWALRRQILSEINGDYFTYTGDFVEWVMLKIYALRPVRKSRKATSATNVRQKMYDSVLTGDTQWEQKVPDKVARIIRQTENWETVKKFANAPDTTRRILGMKFPI